MAGGRRVERSEDMVGQVILGLGGVGLFLLGMTVLTTGLKNLAGAALRRALMRFTATPLKGAAAGAFCTAIIQSSSATTVTAVGFVGAGLLSFPQALGIVFGANIGTTLTGWIVAIIGFKLQLGDPALALVFCGALLRLFGTKRLRDVGWSVAGFGLLFVGIGAMQEGLAQFEGAVTPANFPDDTVAGHLKLVGIGIAITVVTQSSSAGVAAALVALSTGTIAFGQAAAMVIGMDIGTTFTAALATLGGATAMRRTGYAHVIYNGMTGAMAFLMLGTYAALVEPWVAQDAAGNAQIALVAFHTLFNTVGVVVVIPFAAPFAALIVRLVPDSGPPLSRRLDERLLGDPAAAVDAVASTMQDVASYLQARLFEALERVPEKQRGAAQLDVAKDALQTTRDFLDQVQTDAIEEEPHRRLVASMHALDHLLRLVHRCGQSDRIDILRTEARLKRLTELMRSVASDAAAAPDPQYGEERLYRLRELLRRQRQRYRQRVVSAAAKEEVDTDTALKRLDGIRWLHRVSYHLWRIHHHLARAQQESLNIAANDEQMYRDR